METFLKLNCQENNKKTTVLQRDIKQEINEKVFFYIDYYCHGDYDGKCTGKHNNIVEIPERHAVYPFRHARKRNRLC